MEPDDDLDKMMQHALLYGGYNDTPYGAGHSSAAEVCPPVDVRVRHCVEQPADVVRFSLKVVGH